MDKVPGLSLLATCTVCLRPNRAGIGKVSLNSLGQAEAPGDQSKV